MNPVIDPPAAPDDPLWYKDAVIYQTHVKTFMDSNGDGIGDFSGLTEKLDYLKDLGITAVWLLPFYPSPLKDDGYDIANYTGVHPSYGTLRDFNRFMKEAHRLGLRVITELVINHTSDQHPWFQRARRAPKGSRERDFYVWSDSPEKYKKTRIIFKDFEPSNWTVDPVAGAYYWHRFYYHQPDLNFENPEVRKTVFRLMDFWLKRGVDGLRLDAVPYLFEREGTNCENLPETHQFLKELRAHIDKHFPNRMLLAEANQWPEDAVPYFGRGDECHMAFHFPIMPRMFMALRMEDRFPILDIMDQTPRIPESCQWAVFLRNHDELTLEMVTDRERDYMYQVYARDREMRINLGIRRRLAPLLGNDRRAIELMTSLLFSLPGTPVLYYGDEIGMGDNVFLGDRNGVRTPMQWSADRNAGFSRANPQRLHLPIIIDPEYHYEAVNVDTQENNPRSLLWWMKRTIRIRRQHKAFGRGSLSFLKPANPRVLAFVRQFEDETLLIVTNLSRFAQSVQLDLSEHAGRTPVELFGETSFPPITDGYYLMTLGPYAFYWFSLKSRKTEGTVDTDYTIPTLRVRGSWKSALEERLSNLEGFLPAYLRRRRWFGGKARRFDHVKITKSLPLTLNGNSNHLLFVEVEYVDGRRETYLLPLTFDTGEKAEAARAGNPSAILVEIRGTEQGILYDALWDEDFTTGLLKAILTHRRIRGERWLLEGSTTNALMKEVPPLDEMPAPRVSQAEQSNTSILFGDKLILKMFRRLEPGTNPDLEIGRFLTGAGFPNIPGVVGALEYREPNREPSTIAVLHRFVENQGDAWEYTRDYLDRYYESAVARARETQPPREIPDKLWASLDREAPPEARELFGVYLTQAALLGRRTGELHLALASGVADSAFAPEPFTDFIRQSEYQSLRSLLAHVFRDARRKVEDAPEAFRPALERILSLESKIIDRFRRLREVQLSSMRIRIHGDYHLGQVLYTGKDFVILDFEGEPARSLSERRGKKSPLRDAAGMLRSLHYASYASMLEQEEGADPLDLERMEPWRQLWYKWNSIYFLQEYFETCKKAPFMTDNQEEMVLLMEAYLLEKAIYELGYELNNRPDWIRIPMEGILEIMNE